MQTPPDIRPFMIDASHCLCTARMSPFFAAQARKTLDTATHTVSVGVSLGWDDQGDLPEAVTNLYNGEDGGNNTPFVPQALISLGLPWAKAGEFKGRHYLTGRFMYNSLEGLRLPPYQGTDQFVCLSEVSR